MKEKYAPIIITTFTRLDLLKELINSLKLNKECIYSDLYIFSDNFKFLKDKKAVESVRNYIDQLKGFKSIKIIKRSTNFTMAINIIDAIYYVFSKHESLIFLEHIIGIGKYVLDIL